MGHKGKMLLNSQLTTPLLHRSVLKLGVIIYYYHPWNTELTDDGFPKKLPYSPASNSRHGISLYLFRKVVDGCYQVLVLSSRWWKRPKDVDSPPGEWARRCQVGKFSCRGVNEVGSFFAPVISSD